MILSVPEWSEFLQIRHGFGTRLSENWTHEENRTWVKQTHSADVLRVDSPGLQGEGDALVTDQAGLLLEIRTADCIPILVFDPTRQAVAAIHSGWRGTRAEIAMRTIEKMTEWYRSDPGDIYAAIGPAIGGCCFEVGPEVSSEFGLEGRVKLDLARVCREQLLRAGVQRVSDVEICTMCDAARFHSFRRDRETAGRMEAGIEIVRAKKLTA